MRKLAFAVVILSANVASAQPCDRTCLINTVDSYIAALVAHDPSLIAIAKDAKFTENTVAIRPGEGLWKSIQEGPTTFKIYVPDPVSAQVGFVGVITHSGPYVRNGKFEERPPGMAFLALRLKVQDRRITESEVLLERYTCSLLPEPAKSNCERALGFIFTKANLETVRPGLRATLAPSERAKREEILRIGDSYYESIVRSDGDAAPYADDCSRRENGEPGTVPSPEEVKARLAAGIPADRIPMLSCRDQINAGILSYITSIERRVQIADPETGLVFGLAMFRRPSSKTNRLWAHVFKVRDGKIHEIEAVSGVVLPLDSKHGWEPD